MNMGRDVAQLARHLSARLEELEGDCALLRGWDQATDGRVEARFPGRDAGALARRLTGIVPCAADGPDRLVFSLTPDVPFEALDTVWGVLFESLS